MQRNWRPMILTSVVAVGGFFGLAPSDCQAQFPVYETQTVVSQAPVVVGGEGYKVKERRKLFRPRTQVIKVRPLRRGYIASAPVTTTTVIDRPATTTTVIESPMSPSVLEPIPSPVVIPEPVTATSYYSPSPSTSRVYSPGTTTYRVYPR